MKRNPAPLLEAPSFASFLSSVTRGKAGAGSKKTLPPPPGMHEGVLPVLRTAALSLVYRPSVACLSVGVRLGTGRAVFGALWVTVFRLADVCF